VRSEHTQSGLYKTVNFYWHLIVVNHHPQTCKVLRLTQCFNFYYKTLHVSIENEHRQAFLHILTYSMEQSPS